MRMHTDFLSRFDSNAEHADSLVLKQDFVSLRRHFTTSWAIADNAVTSRNKVATGTSASTRCELFINFSSVLLLQKLPPRFEILLGFLEDCKWLMMLLAGPKRIIDRFFADRSVPGLLTRRRGLVRQSEIPRPPPAFAHRS